MAYTNIEHAYLLQVAKKLDEAVAALSFVEEEAHPQLLEVADSIIQIVRRLREEASVGRH